MQITNININMKAFLCGGHLFCVCEVMKTEMVARAASRGLHNGGASIG